MDTLASLNEENEVIQICEPNISFIVDDVTFGKGSLYVAESKLFWKNNLNNQVVSVEYESMCVFGTCNHPTVHEKPCMLIIVDFTYKPSDNMQCENGLTQNGVNHEDSQDNEENNDIDDNEDDEEEMKSKIKLVPDNPDCLIEIYGAFTRNQSRHSRNDMSSEDEGDAFYNENDEFEDDEGDEDEQMLMD